MSTLELTAIALLLGTAPTALATPEQLFPAVEMRDVPSLALVVHPAADYGPKTALDRATATPGPAARNDESHPGDTPRWPS